MIRHYFLLLLSAAVLFPNNVCAMKRKREEDSQTLPPAKRRNIGNTIITAEEFKELLPYLKLKSPYPNYIINFKTASDVENDLKLFKPYQVDIAGLLFPTDTDVASECLNEISEFKNITHLNLPGNYWEGIPPELKNLLPKLNKLKYLKIYFRNPNDCFGDYAPQILEFFNYLPPQIKSITIYGNNFTKEFATIRRDLGWRPHYFEQLSVRLWGLEYVSELQKQTQDWYEENIIKNIINLDPFPPTFQKLKITFISNSKLYANPDKVGYLSTTPLIIFFGIIDFRLKKNSNGQWEYSKSRIFNELQGRS